MKQVPGGWRRLVDVAWLIALALYALAGYRNVPFHGDESTLIFMGHDYFTLVHEGDLDAVLYTATPDDPAAQELRYINGTIGKYTFGLAADLAGLTADDLNEQWLWGAGWEWNVANYHKPSDKLLYAARLSSTLMLAASVWVVFAIGWLVGRGRWSAYVASLVYVMTPAVLINGRRAMMEGSMLLGAVLVVLAGMLLLRARQQERMRWWHYAALGLAAGFAIGSKHTNAIVVVFVFGFVALAQVDWRNLRIWWRSTALWQMFRGVIGAGVLALVVFLLLNPAWWSDTLRMPERVILARQSLIDGQKAMFGAYDGPVEHLTGLITRIADGAPQYYEVDMWGNYIGGEIDAYEDHLWTGVDGGAIGAFVRLVGLAIGTAALLYRRRDPVALLVLVWWWGTVLVLLITTPFNWQRYYLPLQPALAVLLGVAAARLAQALRSGPVTDALNAETQV